MVIVAIYSLRMTTGHASVAEVRGYFDTVPARLGCKLYAQSEWRPMTHGVIAKDPIMVRVRDFFMMGRDSHGYWQYEFKQEHAGGYAGVSVRARLEKVEHIEIYGEFAKPLELRLQKDLSERFPGLTIEVSPDRMRTRLKIWDNVSAF